jgi:ACT domain-containing protein
MKWQNLAVKRRISEKMATILAVKARIIKMRYLIAKGLKPSEVQKELGISRRTYYRDILLIQKEPISEYDKIYLMIYILENREHLLRQMMQVRARARNDEIFLKASMAASEILTSLEKDFARYGLIPSEKKIFQVRRK